MANITTYLENKLLEHATGKNSWTKPTNTYAALFTVTPTTAYTSAAPNGTEVTGTGYGRLAIASGGSSGWASSANGVIANSVALTWTASGSWSSGASINTIGIFDALTAGNLLWFGPLSAPVVMANTDTFNIPIGNLTITIS
jgi:hypothetical protein